MDFSDILAASIHDIKNSLGLILSNVDELVSNPDNQLADPRQASLLLHEAQRANSNLIQLLNLYKLDHQQLVVQITEQNLDELLDEVVANNRSICEALGLQLGASCDPDLSGYLDVDLVRSLLDSTIGNARRYAKSRILLSAEQTDAWLVIRVEDDGAGFPQRLLGVHDSATTSGASSGDPQRTQLGHYFATQIAQLHRTAGREGHIQLKNGHELPGGVFELWLP